MKFKWLQAHMRSAFEYALCSDAKKRQVGAVVVQGNRVVSIGINGTPPGWHTNVCEDLVDGKLVTRPEVLHAEHNALRKLDNERHLAQGASLFITHRPCNECADLIHDFGIKEVFYAVDHPVPKGIEKLRGKGIRVEHLPLERCQVGGHEVPPDQPLERTGS